MKDSTGDITQAAKHKLKSDIKAIAGFKWAHVIAEEAGVTPIYVRRWVRDTSLVSLKLHRAAITALEKLKEEVSI